MLKESSFWVETHKPIDFKYNGKTYRLYENEDSSTKSCIKCCFYHMDDSGESCNAAKANSPSCFGCTNTFWYELKQDSTTN